MWYFNFNFIQYVIFKEQKKVYQFWQNKILLKLFFKFFLSIYFENQFKIKYCGLKMWKIYFLFSSHTTNSVIFVCCLKKAFTYFLRNEKKKKISPFLLIPCVYFLHFLYFYLLKISFLRHFLLLKKVFLSVSALLISSSIFFSAPCLILCLHLMYKFTNSNLALHLDFISFLKI